MYGFIDRVGQCYQLLQDELSRKIFWARLGYDLEQSPENVSKIVSLGEQQAWIDELSKNIPDIIHNVQQNNKKLVLYGTNVTGCNTAELLIKKQLDFYGFCGRRAKQFTNGLLGKPVIEPDYLFNHPDEFYVIISAVESNEELVNILKEKHFPESQIYNVKPQNAIDHQYFEFPALFRPGTAFIDGGCLNCRSSYIFVDWCKGKYSKVYAFEPDPISYSICKQRLEEKEIRDMHLINAGISSSKGTATFRMGLYGASYIVNDNKGGGRQNLVEIPLTTVDDTVGGDEVGFIKMDIEGAEMDALHGSEKTIVRDKPLIAISAYHRVGDMLAIMDYLHQLVPEYRFWLRHYSFGLADTVLYASADVLREE